MIINFFRGKNITYSKNEEMLKILFNVKVS